MVEETFGSANQAADGWRRALSRHNVAATPVAFRSCPH
jgi:hypothetical protein